MRPLPLALLLLALGCGKPAPPKPDDPETASWRFWKSKQISIPAANFAPEVTGKVRILPPQGRSRRSDDFCDFTVNGSFVNRYRVGKLANGTWPVIAATVTLRTGPNWLDLWDSSSDRNCRQQIDTREGLDFVFRPTAQGYELVQERKE